MKKHIAYILVFILQWPLQSCGAQNELPQTNLPEFKRYFAYNINVQETAEIELKFSSEFLNQFPENCILSATVSALLDSPHNEKYIASSNLSRQSVAVFPSFSFYFSGVENEVDIILNYFLEECDFAKTMDKNPTTVSFQIKDIGGFLNTN